MQTQRHSGKAFTLVELLVVMAVIAILAALMASVVSKVKSSAHSTVCKNNLRQTGLALQMYVQEYSRYPYLRSLPEPGDTNQNNGWWFAKLARYDPVEWTDARYHCPGYRGAISAATGRQEPFGSYAYNALGVRPPFGGYDDPTNGISIRFLNTSFGLGPMLYVSFPRKGTSTTEPQIRRPSEMLAIGESRFLSEQVNHTPGGRCDMVCGMLNWSSGHGPQDWAFDSARHGKNYNQFFCDGHIAAINPGILFNYTNSAALWNYDHEPHAELWVPN